MYVKLDVRKQSNQSSSLHTVASLSSWSVALVWSTTVVKPTDYFLCVLIQTRYSDSLIHLFNHIENFAHSFIQNSFSPVGGVVWLLVSGFGDKLSPESSESRLAVLP